MAEPIPRSLIPMTGPEPTTRDVDLNALREVVAEHTALLRNRIRRRVVHHDDVEEILQDTLTCAIASVASLRDPDALRPWLLTIAERTIMDRRRAAMRHPRPESLMHEVADHDQASQVERGTESLEFWQLVSGLLQSLPSDLREAGRRHFLLGDSLHAISTALGRTKSTIQARIVRVRAALAAMLARSGYAASAHMLDVGIPHPADGGASLLPPPRSAAFKFAIAGVAILGAAVAALLAVSLWSSGTRPAQASEARAIAIAQTAPVVAANQSHTDPTAMAHGRRPYDPDPEVLIHGRVVDADSGLPIAAATVVAYDYLYQRDLTHEQSDEQGLFRIEATRGQIRPFEVYVESPRDRGYGRVRLGAIVPEPAERTVQMLPAIDVLLTVSKSQYAILPLEAVEVSVVAVQAGDHDVPDGMFRELLPPRHSILATVPVGGSVRDIRLRQLPQTELGFLMRAPDGRCWFGYTDQASQNLGTDAVTGDSTARRKRDCTIALYTGDWYLINPRSTSWDVRRSLCNPEDVCSYSSDPILTDVLSGLCDAGWHGARDSIDLADEDQTAPATAFHGIANLLPEIADPISPAESARLRLDLGALAPTNTQSQDSVLIVVRQANWLGSIVGFRAAHSGEVLTLDPLPTGESLVIEITRPPFQQTIHRSWLQIPRSDRGRTIDLAATTKSVLVHASYGRMPREGCSAGLAMHSAQGIASHGDQEIQAQTDKAGNAKLSVANLTRYSMSVNADLPGAKVSVAEDGDLSREHNATHEFDFQIGFKLRIREGGDLLTIGDDRQLRVEGVVIGERRVSFSETFGACNDGLVVVSPGVAGVVNARLCRKVPGIDQCWIPVQTLRATSATLDANQAPIEVHLATPSTIAGRVALRFTDESGPLAAESLALELQVAPPAFNDQGLQTTIDWSAVAWSGRDGSANIEIPLALQGARLKIRTQDHLLALAEVPPLFANGIAPLAIRLVRGREVVFAEQPEGEREPIGCGLRNGDTVAYVGNRAVSCRSEWEAALAAADTDAPLSLGIRRGDALQYLILPPPWRRFLRGLKTMAR